MMSLQGAAPPPPPSFPQNEAQSKFPVYFHLTLHLILCPRLRSHYSYRFCPYFLTSRPHIRRQNSEHGVLPLKLTFMSGWPLTSAITRWNFQLTSELTSHQKLRVELQPVLGRFTEFTQNLATQFVFHGNKPLKNKFNLSFCIY